MTPSSPRVSLPVRESSYAQQQSFLVNLRSLDPPEESPKFDAEVVRQMITPGRRFLKKSIVLFLYVIVGWIFYGHVEGWNTADCISFSVATMSTVGYGYHHPTNDRSRIFTIFYICFGVYFVFASIAHALSRRLERLSAYFQTLTDADRLASKYSRHKRLIVLNISAIVVTVFVGAIFLIILEDWTFAKALYFAVETTTTVGYGDIPISNRATHIFLGFYIVLSTVLLTFAWNNFQVLKRQKKQLRKIEQTVLRRKDLQFLANLDHGVGITEEQFVLAILHHLGTIDMERDIEPWIKRFKELNPDLNGRVYRDTLTDFSAAEFFRASVIPEFEPRPTLSNLGGLIYSVKKETPHAFKGDAEIRPSTIKETPNAGLIQNQHDF